MRRYYIITTLLAMLLITGCADDKVADDATPDGYGRLTITISTPEAAQTRAVDTTTPWLEGSSYERAIKSYHLLVCNGNTIIDAVSGDELALGSHEDDPKNYYLSTQTITSNPIAVGTYNFTFYCLANFTSDMMTAAGLTVSDGKVTNTTLPDGFEKKVMQPIVNGTSAVPSTGLPMTGKLEKSSVTIARGTPATISDPLILWRMMAKLDFQFTNLGGSKVQVTGIEVESINQANQANSSGVYLISQDNLFSLNNLKAPYYNQTVNQSGVTATWALSDLTLQTAAAVSKSALISQAQLMWGSKIESTGQTTTNSTYLQKFKAIEKVTNRDERSAVIFTVKAAAGLTFKPTALSFKACRVGTDTGHFDVVAVSGGSSTDVATAVQPERNSVSTYSYDLSSKNIAATAGVFYVKIYLYDLNATKEYAFSDVVITGEVKKIEGSTGEGITLPSAALTDVGKVIYEPTTLELNATNGTGNISFYVNETDATFTTTENQFSIRFKVKRWNASASDWYEQEIRYGMTVPYVDGTTGGNGFNVIRRNDWIHIPIYIADWIFRVEPLAFVPIAGYPAVTVSSDALTTTFSTGGLIALKPFAQKNNDGTWRDFSDPEVTFVSLSWKNNDGTDVFGSGKIVKTAFTYDPVNHCVVGELNNTLSPGTYKTTLTINVKLGPSGSQYDYSFTCNVILQ